MRIGDFISKGTVTDFRVLQERLASFTKAYMITKLLVATFMVNVFIWKASPLGHTSNLKWAGLALTVLGVFFVSVPRLYLELRWFQYKTSVGDEIDDAYKDIRPGKIRLISAVLDTFLIGAFIGAFWGINLDITALLPKS